MRKVCTITTRTAGDLRVETELAEGRTELTFQASSAKPCLLHWGVRSAGREAWEAPPASSWPPGTAAFGLNAVQTPFDRRDGTGQW